MSHSSNWSVVAVGATCAFGLALMVLRPTAPTASYASPATAVSSVSSTVGAPIHNLRMTERIAKESAPQPGLHNTPIEFATQEATPSGLLVLVGSGLVLVGAAILSLGRRAPRALAPLNLQEPLAMAAMTGRSTRGHVAPLRAEEWDTDFGSLFGNTWDLPEKETKKKEDEEWYKDIEISSQSGVDYSLLKELLKTQQWELADNEHRRLLIELSGPSAEAREYAWPSEVTKIPEQDMQMLDKLWMNYSGGKFGFSVQRRLWAGVRGNWVEFFKKINWVTGENNDYRKWPKGFLWTIDAEKGHLPLTNALRGTGLLEAVFEHPAFGGPLKNKQVRK